MPERDGSAVDSERPIRSAVRPTQEPPGKEDAKRIDTRGQACPNPDCDYHRIADPAVHALVGYGHDNCTCAARKRKCRCGRQDPIQDFYCQACHCKFSARRHTALYRVKTPPAQAAQVLHAIAEGLSEQAAARVFQLSETTVRCWLSRAGQHSQSLHQRLMLVLQLTHVQLDELRLKLRGTAEAAWLWVACDARTKIIPAVTLGPRTQAMAHQLVHEVAQRLAPGCLPVVSSDGLSLYYYALTAHFGEWVQALGGRRRVSTVNARLLYSQVVKQHHRRRLDQVRHQVILGKPDEYRQTLSAQGFSGRIQTAFIERLNLAIRRLMASLARRSWSAAHSLSELALQFEWWRAASRITSLDPIVACGT